MRRGFLLPALCCAVAALTASPALAARKAPPAPSPSPTAAPTATPEPLDHAIPRLETQLKTDPNNVDAMQELAGDYLQSNRPDLALGLTQKLLQSGTKNAMVYYFDGYAQNALGRPAQAISDLEQASNLDPTNASVLSLLTQLYLQANRTADAERVAKRAATFNPTNAKMLMNYGMVLDREAKYDEARAQYDAAAKLTPTDATPIIFEARTYVEQNAIALAIQVYDRALAVDPTSGDAMLGKAELLGQQHDVKDAIALYETVFNRLTDAPTKAAVIDQEARLYADEKMNDQAVAAFKRAISQFPNILDTYLAYGDYLAYVKQLPQAEAQWTAALGPKGDNPPAIARLGAYYAQTNQPAKAVDQFKHLTEVAPNDPEAFMSLGQTYLMVHQFDKAHDTFRQAYDMTHAPQALAGVGEADYNLKNYKEAAAVFDALEKGVPQFMQANPPLIFLAGKCYAANKESAKAKSEYTRLLALVKPNSDDAKQVRKALDELDKSGGKPAAKAGSGAR